MPCSVDTSVSWINMFETMCARYRCRSIETIARAMNDPAGNRVYFISGPGGKWLAEVTSVGLTVPLEYRADDDYARYAGGISNSRCYNDDGIAVLSDVSTGAVRDIVNRYDETDRFSRVEYSIVFDWIFLQTQKTDDRSREQPRQRGQRSTASNPSATASSSKFRTRSTNENSDNVNEADDDDNNRVYTNRSTIVPVSKLRLIGHETTIGRRRYTDIEERQCLLRVDRHNRIVTIIVLANTTRNQTLSSISVACNRDTPDCLRPFPFFLACELATRNTRYDNLNIYHDVEKTPTRCWLTEARAMYSHAKMLRVSCRMEQPIHNILDRICCQCVNLGDIRHFWRDGRILPKNSSHDGLGPSMHLFPATANLNISRLEADVRRDERHILSLCDFDVFTRRCDNILASAIMSMPRDLDGAMHNAMYYGVTRDAATYHVENASRHTARDSKLYEQRYFVDSRNNLVSLPFMRLS